MPTNKKLLKSLNRRAALKRRNHLIHLRKPLSVSLSFRLAQLFSFRHSQESK
jgi:hypothetical protein